MSNLKTLDEIGTSDRPVTILLKLSDELMFRLLIVFADTRLKHVYPHWEYPKKQWVMLKVIYPGPSPPAAVEADFGPTGNLMVEFWQGVMNRQPDWGGRIPAFHSDGTIESARQSFRRSFKLPKPIFRWKPHVPTPVP